MFWRLGAALFVDGIDGTFARRYRVAEVLPRWSGDTLDLVVDFITYVFVPAYAIAASGVAARRYWRSRRHCDRGHQRALFRRPRDEDRGQLLSRISGFVERGGVLFVPVLKPAPWLTAALIVVLAVLTFVPFMFLHPFRVT